MIKIEGLSKSYGTECILKDIHIEISSPKWITIAGHSGSGKSTLLNIIALTDTRFTGTYEFDGRNVSSLSEAERRKIIFGQITYLFQEPTFIENESVRVNLELIAGRKLDSETLEKKFAEFRLHVREETNVSHLSKGERKRISLIGASLRDTPVVLCDEITAGLDAENTRIVLRYLKRISKKKIVILVTHDLDSVRNFCPEIYEIRDHQMKEMIVRGGMKGRKEKPKDLKNGYRLLHIAHSFRRKRWRSFAFILTMVLCLFTMGLSLMIEDSVENHLIRTVTSYFGTDRILLRSKTESSDLVRQEVVDIEEFSDFRADYDDLIVQEYVAYCANFENYFRDENCLTLNLKNVRCTLNEFGVRSLSEFLPLSLSDQRIYPLRTSLKPNEIVLGLTPVQIATLCQNLKLGGIQESDLENYLRFENIPASFYLANEEWAYALEIPLKAVGFFLSAEPIIYASDPFFNEIVVEEKMQLPFSYFLNESDYYPWTVKKICGLIVRKEDVSAFFERMLSDEKMESFSFHLADEEDFPLFYRGQEAYDLIYLTYKNAGSLSLREIETICAAEANIRSFLPCGSKSYAVDRQSLLSGFDMPVYLSPKEEILNEFIDLNSLTSYNFGTYQAGGFTSVEENFYSLSLMDNSRENFIRFVPYSPEDFPLIEGEYPREGNQVLISSSLAEQLPPGQDFVYLTALKEILPEGASYRNRFKTIRLSVSGIVRSDQRLISQSPIYPMLLSNVMFGIRQYDQTVDSCLLQLGENSDQILTELNSRYPNYVFENPLKAYLNRIEGGVNALTLGLLFFSCITLIAGLFMMILVNHLFLKESEKEIAVYSFLGYSRKSIIGYFFLFSGLLLGIGLALSLTGLFVAVFLIPVIESSMSYFSWSWPSFWILFGVSLLTYGIANGFTLRYFYKKDIIDLIKNK